MSNRVKNILYSAVLLLSIYLVWNYRKSNSDSGKEVINIDGQTMGTTYHITYFDSHGRNFKEAVDSLLQVVNKSINNYDSTSEVSRFNRSERGIAVDLPYLLPPLQKASMVFHATDGAFDPTVMPLVNAWGFGPNKNLHLDSVQIDSIKSFIGFEKIIIREDSVLKTDPRIQLDFGGIGQGYGADVITDFLKSKGITDMLVELGGEGMAIGQNLKTNKGWQIGILDPASTRDHQFFKAYATLTNQSFTTSGNYFNYKIENGVRYSHTIDPVTGYPARRAILSASVFSSDCTTADAWGTALMVMGHEKAMEILKDHPEIDVLLIYSTPDGKPESYISPGANSYINIEPNK
ncbi:MAG TPA: FAD:protein FMN transferase [Ohtaekwangia sp.]|nr:FAD:protein FMN transferase [Ohtaekwangia sp.]